MSHITDLPNGVSDAGIEFNYSVWAPGSKVVLCNVPWSNDYRDIVKFANQDALNSYLMMGNYGSPVEITKMTYISPGQPIRIDVPFNAAYRFNYLRVNNPAQPIAGDFGRDLYYFILDVRRNSPNTTELVVQLDVWQTFGYGVSFGRCYVEQGHIGVANQNRMNDNGREYLTIPEGLDLGSEYGIARQYSHVFGDAAALTTTNSIDIIMATTVSLDGSGGTVDAPTLVASKGSSFENLPNGAELYWFNGVTEFQAFMEAASSVPWVTAGIISITAVPNLASVSTQEINPAFPGPLLHRLTKYNLPSERINLVSNWRTDVMYSSIPERYRHLDKFLTYPYCQVEMTTYSGTPLSLKPEAMYGQNLEVVKHLHLAPPNPRVAFTPYKYNATPEADGSFTSDYYVNGRFIDDGGEMFDMMTGLFDLPTFSVANNSYLQYMAANKNSIAYQHSTADWSQTRALTGAGTAAGQATAAMSNAQQQNDIQLRLGSQSAEIATSAAIGQALVGGATGLAGGAAGGPAGIASAALGAASSGAGVAISNNARMAQLAAQQSAMRQGLASNLQNSAYNRDTNLEFANFAAKGDYQNAIAGINARVQDAKMIQPTTSGQTGGDAFLLATNQWALHAKVKVLQTGVMASIGEYWLRYGYAINRFTTPPATLQVMTHFTYWKMKETYLSASQCPELFRQTIRGIFEKGVTVWQNPNDMATIDIGDNRPLEGVTL